MGLHSVLHRFSWWMVLGTSFSANVFFGGLVAGLRGPEVKSLLVGHRGPEVKFMMAVVFLLGL